MNQPEVCWQESTVLRRRSSEGSTKFADLEGVPQIGLRDRRWDFEMDRTAQFQATADERRGTQRFMVNVPLKVVIVDREIPGYTRDLSNRGVYFYLTMADSALIDPDFEFVVELPPEITLSTCCRIRCRARQLRKEKTSGDLSGIAAEILDYSILRETMSMA